MAHKKLKKSSNSGSKSEPTVLHESSADNAQNIGIENGQRIKTEKENISYRRKHKGSDGEDQERGSNH